MADGDLTLAFHGRIIEHIGDQMYQSPTAAIAEMVSNGWDADSTVVSITWSFDSETASDWWIKIEDDGNGMTKEECQARFLSVGYNRREKDGPTALSPKMKRPLMGRKGIGKFAGFGIAQVIEVDTVSKETGEQTKFRLDYSAIRKGDSYVSTDHLKVPTQHSVTGDRTGGTHITLRNLGLSKRISQTQFIASLARRFLINATADEFVLTVNGVSVTDEIEIGNVEMSFPRDFPVKDICDRHIVIDAAGWGDETLPSGRMVKWRVQFFGNLIENEEIRGITIFAHRKLAQRPFFFNIVGGTASQAGPEYLSGKVVADWVDELPRDVISTERQRLNWESPELSELQVWGEKLVRRLMTLWKQQRTQEKMAALEAAVGVFKDRLQALGSEAPVVRTALEKLAQIEKLSKVQFQELGTAILFSWEKGRLRGLISKIAMSDTMDEGELVSILTEANAITALHTAEMVSSRIAAITGLEARVRDRDLENAVRDYIASKPWLISPRWETFAVEQRLTTLCSSAHDQAFKDHADFDKRFDLVLSSDRQLLLLEFMRPGKTIDHDHLSRFQLYVSVIKEYIEANSGLGIEMISGYLVADHIVKSKAGIKSMIETMRKDGLLAMDWETLIGNAKSQWKEFLDHVKARAPDDPRLTNFDQANDLIAAEPQPAI